MSEKFAIAIASDHAGYEYKTLLKEHLSKLGHPVVDYGTDSLASVDYPDYVHPLADAVEAGRQRFGVLICGSAQGVAMTANKHQGIRAAVAWQTDIARLARQHNDANVVCIPARFIAIHLAQDIVSAFLATDFEGGRHQLRVDKVALPC